jgi:hypothetical protein
MDSAMSFSVYVIASLQPSVSRSVKMQLAFASTVIYGFRLL